MLDVVVGPVAVVTVAENPVVVDPVEMVDSIVEVESVVVAAGVVASLVLKRFKNKIKLGQSTVRQSS